MREQGAERLLQLMTQLPDDLLEEAISYQQPGPGIAPRAVAWNKGTLVAACLCMCLVGGLMWSTLRESLGERETTLAGVTAGGIIGSNEGKPTLSPSVDQTGNAETMASEFVYRGQRYVDTGILLEELPDTCVWQGVLSGSGLATETEWITKDLSLVGANVYCMEGDITGLYVEVTGGYRYYGKESAGE